MSQCYWSARNRARGLDSRLKVPGLPAAIPGCAMATLVLLFVMDTHAAPSGQLDLLEATERGDLPAVERLITAGAQLDAADSAGRTALLVAVDRGRLDAAERLIRAGASINAAAANHDTPWLLAGALGRTEMLRLMIPKGPDFSLRNRYGGSALIPACERGHADTVKLLLTTKIDVNHVNNLGWTCLLEAVILGPGGTSHIEIVRSVLAAGANPNLADRDGVSPLTHARRKAQQEIARLIADAGGR
jgi:ankyrin repeat protein